MFKKNNLLMKNVGKIKKKRLKIKTFLTSMHFTTPQRVEG